MSDQATSLPIRTEASGDVDIIISDAVVPSQKLVIEADGSINTNVTGTDLDIRDLVFATDKVDVSGSEVSLDATTLAALETVTVASITADVSIDDGGNSITVDAVDLDIRDLVFATDKVDVSGSTLTGITNDVNIADGGNSITVDAVDLDIRDLTAASDSIQANLFDEAGIAYSATNPLPVELVSDQAGDEVCDYNTTATVAKNASTNHDYTVTALKTLLLESVWVSASGKVKVEVLSNGVPIYTGFNSTANPNIDIPVSKICKTAAGNVIRLTITNLDNQAQDVYSTVTGLEV